MSDTEDRGSEYFCILCGVRWMTAAPGGGRCYQCHEKRMVLPSAGGRFETRQIVAGLLEAFVPRLVLAALQKRRPPGQGGEG